MTLAQNNFHVAVAEQQRALRQQEENVRQQMLKQQEELLQMQQQQQLEALQKQQQQLIEQQQSILTRVNNLDHDVKITVFYDFYYFLTANNFAKLWWSKFHESESRF